MRKKTRRHILYAALALVLVAGLIMLLSIAGLTVTEYQLVSHKITEDIRLVQLADFHDNIWLGERLYDKVRELMPDAILLTGDQLNFNSDGTELAVTMIHRLTEIAPVYLSVGNHEVGYMRRSGQRDLLELFRQAGAVVLDDRYAELSVRGQRLRIGGIYNDLFNRRELSDEAYRGSNAYRFLSAFENTDALKVLLCHKPEHMLTEDENARWDIDLALCGHEHGGQVRLPLLGGVYSTHLGFFSPYLDGAHLLNGIPTVISRGLGTYTWNSWGIPIPPRFWNVPEIVLVTLTGAAPAAL